MVFQLAINQNVLRDLRIYDTYPANANRGTSWQVVVAFGGAIAVCRFWIRFQFQVLRVWVWVSHTARTGHFHAHSEIPSQSFASPLSRVSWRCHV